MSWVIASIVRKRKNHSDLIFMNLFRTLRLYFLCFRITSHLVLHILALKAANLFENFRYAIVFNCWRILHGGLKRRRRMICQVAECLNVLGGGLFHIECESRMTPTI